MTADTPREVLLACHECSGTGVFGEKAGARWLCELCNGNGKFADRRATPEPAAGAVERINAVETAATAMTATVCDEIVRLAEYWADKAFDHGASPTGEDTHGAERAAETAFRAYVDTALASAPDWRDRFWQIIDGRGLLGLPSDEWNALSRLVDSYASVSAPPGWMIVPVEPTEAMVDAVVNLTLAHAYTLHAPIPWDEGYRLMIAAAVKP